MIRLVPRTATRYALLASPTLSVSVDQVGSKDSDFGESIA